MKRVVWLTDIHLNFVKPPQISEFLAQVVKQKPDVVLVGGDIGEGHTFSRYLQEMARAIPCPIYFVLGNHDFYCSSIAETRKRAASIATDGSGLTWLTSAGVVRLTENTGLIGHEGWADGRLGDYATSRIMLNDYALIQDLECLTKAGRLEVLNRLGDEAAKHVRRELTRALRRFPRVILLTHVPPFRNACWHEGQVSGDAWLPHFGCQAMGQVILDCMTAHPNQSLTVLCGHTHGAGETRPLRNVRVLTGAAGYGEPSVARTFKIK